MVSLETCKKLQEEIITLIGDNLLEDDDLFLNLISQSKDSKGVLGLATNLKEAGISLYKDDKLDDALEKYGYGVMILARYHFEEESDRMEFLKLAISILMNSGPCFSKKKEYVEVGRICSIVLEFDPYNVKAMYRRAMAALELGKRDWARLDLWMALDIDPNNKDVIKKLEELKDKPSKENSMSLSNGAIPAGLGIGLSLPKQKKSEVMDRGRSKLQGDSQVNDSCKKDEGQQTHGKDSLEVREEGGDDNNLTTNQEDGEVEAQRQVSSIIELGKEEKEQRNKVLQNDMMVDKSSLSEEEDKQSCVGSKEMDQPSPCVQPRYRFRSARRHGFTLTISKHDYHLMTQGKSLKYYDENSGSFMEVRFPSRFNEDLTDDSGVSMQQKVHIVEGGTQMNVDKDRWDSSESMENSSDNHSCVTDSNYASNKGEECSSQLKSHTTFYFSAQPKPAIRKRHGTRFKCHTTPANANKRRRSHHNQPILPNICRCRSDQRNKRKCELPVPLDSHHHPRKKRKCSFSPVWKSYSRTQDPGYCTSSSDACTNSSGDIVSSCTSVRSCVDSTICDSNVSMKVQGNSRSIVEEASEWATVTTM